MAKPNISRLLSAILFLTTSVLAQGADLSRPGSKAAPAKPTGHTHLGSSLPDTSDEQTPLQQIPASIAGFKIELREFQNTRYRVVTIDPRRVHLQMNWQRGDGSALGSLQDLRKFVIGQGELFLFGTNAGMYDKSLKPLGLYIENRKTLRKVNAVSNSAAGGTSVSRVGTKKETKNVSSSNATTAPGGSHPAGQGPGGNFALLPNGIFLLRSANSAAHSDGTATGTASDQAQDSVHETEKAEVINTTDFQSSPSILFATQSGPLLLEKGQIHPQFTKGSLNQKLRSGVGVNAKGDAVFVLSRGGVSFYDFAVFFRDELGCENALYLDGTISDFLVGNEASTQLAPFVGMISATLRAGDVKTR